MYYQTFIASSFSLFFLSSSSCFSFSCFKRSSSSFFCLASRSAADGVLDAAGADPPLPDSLKTLTFHSLNLFCNCKCENYVILKTIKLLLEKKGSNPLQMLMKITFVFVTS